jgi:hypothetical protein
MVLGEPVATVDWCDESPDSVLPSACGPSKPLLLGLPCSHCRAYYDAQLTDCPVCGCSERVSPTPATLTVRPKSHGAETTGIAEKAAAA